MALAVTSSSSTAISGSSFSRSGASSESKGTNFLFHFLRKIIKIDSLIVYCYTHLLDSDESNRKIFKFGVAALQICSIRLSDRTHLSQRRYSMKPLNVESHSRNESWVSRASTLIAPGSCL